MFVVFSAALGVMKSVAQDQVEIVEARMMAVRSADFQHFNGRFDRTEEKLDRILNIIKEGK